MQTLGQPNVSGRAQLTPRHLRASKARIFMGQYGCWASVLPVALLHPHTLFSLLLACPSAVVFQRRVRARGLPSRRDRWRLGLLELLGCLLTQLRRGRAERGEAVQQPHVSKTSLPWSSPGPSAGPHLGEEPNASLSPREAGDHHPAGAVLPPHLHRTAKRCHYAVIGRNDVILKHSGDSLHGVTQPAGQRKPLEGQSLLWLLPLTSRSCSVRAESGCDRTQTKTPHL